MWTFKYLFLNNLCFTVLLFNYYFLDTNENLRKLLSTIVKKNIGKIKKISFYNAFTRFCYREFKNGRKTDWKLSNEEIMLW